MTLRSTLTAAAAAISIAFTAATPAIASPDSDDLLRFLAGAAALAIIADGLNQPSYYPTYPTYPAPTYPRPYPVYPVPVYPPVYPRPVPAPHPVPPRPHYTALPASCAIKIQTRNGWEKAYTSDCLARAGYNRNLPQHCLREIRSTSGWNRIYGDYCLRQAGY